MSEATHADRVREMIWRGGEIEESPDEEAAARERAEARRRARLRRRLDAVRRPH